MFDESFLQAQRNRAIAEVRNAADGNDNGGVSINDSDNAGAQHRQQETPSSATSTAALIGGRGGAVDMTSPFSHDENDIVDGGGGGSDRITDSDSDSSDDNHAFNRSLPIKKKLGETVVTLDGIFKRECQEFRPN